MEIHLLHIDSWAFYTTVHECVSKGVIRIHPKNYPSVICIENVAHVGVGTRIGDIYTLKTMLRKFEGMKTTDRIVIA